MLFFWECFIDNYRKLQAEEEMSVSRLYQMIAS